LVKFKEKVFHPVNELLILTFFNLPLFLETLFNLSFPLPKRKKGAFFKYWEKMVVEKREKINPTTLFLGE